MRQGMVLHMVFYELIFFNVGAISIAQKLRSSLRAFYCIPLGLCE